MGSVTIAQYFRRHCEDSQPTLEFQGTDGAFQSFGVSRSLCVGLRYPGQGERWLYTDRLKVYWVEGPNTTKRLIAVSGHDLEAPAANSNLLLDNRGEGAYFREIENGYYSVARTPECAPLPESPSHFSSIGLRFEHITEPMYGVDSVTEGDALIQPALCRLLPDQRSTSVLYTLQIPDSAPTITTDTETTVRYPGRFGRAVGFQDLSDGSLVFERWIVRE